MNYVGQDAMCPAYSCKATPTSRVEILYIYDHDNSNQNKALKYNSQEKLRPHCKAQCIH